VPSTYVFPIKAGAKYPPCFDDNLALASNDLAKLKEWDANYHGSNWGVALKRSRLIVPDVDIRAGKIGGDTLNDLETRHGRLPNTLTVRSPSGGRHYYFTETNIVKHQMRVSAFGPDVDSTNYVLLPGCRLTTGGAYTIINDAPIAPAPDWLAEYLRESDDTEVEQIPQVELEQDANMAWAIQFLTHDAKPSVQGRNGEFALLMAAAALKDHGISQRTAIELLDKHYNVEGRCDPPWNVSDGPIADRLDIKVENAWRYLTQVRPGARTAQADFADDPPPAAAELAEFDAWWKAFDASPAQRQKAMSRARWARARRLVTIPDKDRQPQRPVP
jgi:hypothetical protein